MLVKVMDGWSAGEMRTACVVKMKRGSACLETELNIGLFRLSAGEERFARCTP